MTPTNASLQTDSDESRGTTKELRVLTQEQESFCAWVASGVSYAESARRVGWTPANGYYTKDLPQVKARIAELIETRKSEDIGGIATKSWIETHMVRIIDRIEEGETGTEQLEAYKVEVQTLMALAKLKGHVIERKATLNAHVRSNAGQGGELSADAVAEYLDALEPGSRDELAERVKAIGARKGRRRQAQLPPPRTPRPADDVVDAEIVEPDLSSYRTDA